MAYNKAAQLKYHKKCQHIAANLYPESDADIKAFLESTDEPTATLIKKGLRVLIEQAKSQKSQDE